MEVRLASRINELGELGRHLRTHLDAEDLKKSGLSGTGWVTYIGRLAVTGHRLRAAAVSMLLSDYPIQVALRGSELQSLVELEGFLDRMKADGSDFKLFKRGKDVLPLKSHPGATNKVNVWFSNVFAGLEKQDRRFAMHVLQRQELFKGLYNDAGSALLMYACLTRGVVEDPLGLAAYMVHNPKEAKALSTVIKSLGCNGTRIGAVMAELGALQGRGVSGIDFEDEGRYRCSENGVKDHVVDLNPSKLREMIDKVVKSELAGRKCVFDDLETHWQKRWLWCVNGAHSNALVKREKQWATGFTQRMHRKVFAENIDYEPVSRWSGTSYFTMSQKLELGKTRAIFGGDTVSYFAFDHLLSSVERAWGERRVLLNPGKGGNVAVVDRIRNMRKSGAWSVMLDYDDFNSQHTLLAQAMVIDSIVKVSGYDEVLGAKLVRSIFNQKVVNGNEVLDLWGTLMSGHRATTIINSILNLAYILVANEEVESMTSVHVGDDIVIMTESADRAFKVLEDVGRAGLRMNPLKQSVGVITTELLRIAVTDDCSYGYLARSIGSAISGNWASEAKLSPREALTTMVSSSWTLANRSGSLAGYLLMYDVGRVSGLPVKHVRKYLDGKASLGGSPVRSMHNVVEIATVEEVETNRAEDVVTEVARLGGARYATEDYLSHSIDSVERLALTLAGGDVAEMMVRSSYAKTLISRDIISSAGLKVTTTHKQLRGYRSVNFCDLVKKEVEHPGILSHYPLINLIKNRLTEQDVYRLLRAAGDKEVSCPYERAFGTKEKNVIAVSGCASFSDLMTYGHRAEGRHIHVLYEMYL
ncbi:RNA dependent RNA polymerase [viral metagenome]